MRAIPDLLSYLRILIAPMMLVASFGGDPIAFGLLVAAGLVTDFLDGMLARRLGVANAAGSHLDSVADVERSISCPFLRGEIPVLRQPNACRPVCARPRISAWMSWVPS